MIKLCLVYRRAMIKSCLSFAWDGTMIKPYGSLCRMIHQIIWCIILKINTHVILIIPTLTVSVSVYVFVFVSIFVLFAMTFAMCHILHHILFDKFRIVSHSWDLFIVLRAGRFAVSQRKYPNCIKLHWTDENFYKANTQMKSKKEKLSSKLSTVST